MQSSIQISLSMLLIIRLILLKFITQNPFLFAMILLPEWLSFMESIDMSLAFTHEFIQMCSLERSFLNLLISILIRITLKRQSLFKLNNSLTLSKERSEDETELHENDSKTAVFDTWQMNRRKNEQYSEKTKMKFQMLSESKWSTTT